MRYEDLISEEVLADALDLTVQTVRKYTRENRIPSIELPSGEVRYYLDAVLLALTGELPFYRKESDKNYTYQDYLDLPSEPGIRHEVINGKLISRSLPAGTNKIVSEKLGSILYDYFHPLDPRGKIFTVPLTVKIHDNTVVQPDLLYISGQQLNIIKEDRIDGVPNLIVEIAYPVFRNTDSFKKLQVYLKAGVLHYWIVDPEDRSLHCFAQQNEKYAVAAMGINDDVVEHRDFAGLAIPLGILWT